MKWVINPEDISQVFLVFLFDARGTHNNNYDIFTKLPEFKLYLQ